MVEADELEARARSDREHASRLLAEAEQRAGRLIAEAESVRRSADDTIERLVVTRRELEAVIQHLTRLPNTVLDLTEHPLGQPSATRRVPRPWSTCSGQMPSPTRRPFLWAPRLPEETPGGERASPRAARPPLRGPPEPTPTTLSSRPVTPTIPWPAWCGPPSTVRLGPGRRLPRGRAVRRRSVRRFAPPTTTGTRGGTDARVRGARGPHGSPASGVPLVGRDGSSLSLH